ncbi:MAG: TerB family tellurite resistance protein [Polyangiaceae bacterium]|nr:TerB family tellurite resistance protein [Polyangiaceae bacterium]
MNLTQEISRRIERLIRRFPEEDVLVLVDLMVLVANADGNIDPDEHVALSAGIESILGSRVAPEFVSEVVVESLDKLAEENLDLRALAIGHLLAERGEAEEGLRIGIAVALASGGLAEPEYDLLGTVARAAGVSGARLDVLIDHVREGLSFDV